MAWPTAKEIVNDAAVELGLLSAALDDPLASSDQAMVQLVALLKAAGRLVIREGKWTHLVREHTFATVALQKAYALPADFRTMIPQTGWDRTGTSALGGPLSPQQWQCAKGKGDTYAGDVLFRPANGELWLLEDALVGALTVAFEYRSSFWAGESAATLPPTKEYPVASLDVVFLDSWLMSRALKLLWKREKGFDSTAAQQDYDDALAKVRDDDAPARVLSFGGGGGVKFIDECSVPDTGVLT